MSINRVVLVGNLGTEPETKAMSGGSSVCRFRVATNERFKNSNGEVTERTEWHTVVAWNKLGESCAKFLSKGSKVLIEGSIRTSRWQGQDGTEKFFTEIVAKSVEFLDKSKNQASDAEYDNVSGVATDYNQ